MLEAGGCALCGRDAGGYALWLLCMLEAVEGQLCLLEVLQVPEVNALCATLYIRGCGGWVLFAGGVGGDAPYAAV